jgi:predicted NAD/FAD-dependent oxidoreductase
LRQILPYGHGTLTVWGGMSKILVLGGGVVGLSIAMMLARQGHDVTVFERDNEPLPGSPEEAWQASTRRGVAQFRQAHYLQPPVGHLLDSHLPDVKEEWLRAGCVRFDVLTTMPPSITDRTPKEGDERFTRVAAPRSSTRSQVSPKGSSLSVVAPASCIY